MAVVPKANRYIRHIVIDEIATEINKEHRDGATRGLSFDVESFCLEVLRKEVVWTPIKEPSGRVCFASITDQLITLNSNHRVRYEDKPFLLRSCLGHEVGHQLLGHLDILRSNPDQQDLFGVTATSEFTFHDSACAQLGLTPDEMRDLKADLAREAFENPRSYEQLRKLEDKLEPDWMFRQAEQFASCFLIPWDQLEVKLEGGADYVSWPGIYGLAATFGVSASMMKVRLIKRGLIKEVNGTIISTPYSAQQGLGI
jgi:IrrE N-terminal-like domain